MPRSQGRSTAPGAGRSRSRLRVALAGQGIAVVGFVLATIANQRAGDTTAAAFTGTAAGAVLLAAVATWWELRRTQPAEPERPQSP